MQNTSKNEFFLSVIQLADIASEISTKYFRKNIEIDSKSNNTPVTIVDREIELAIRSWITKNYPTHDIMGEEYTDVIADGKYTWVIDPIDGTVAFSSGKPLFTTLIALLCGNTPMIGIVDQPILGDRFIAVRDEGAWLNGVRLQTSDTTEVSQARLNATTPYMFKTDFERQTFDKVKQEVLLTGFGGDAYSYGLLASGHIDIIVEADLGYYDIAPLVVLIEEAGGVFTNWQGYKIDKDNFNGQVLATANMELHKKVLEIINK